MRLPFFVILIHSTLATLEGPHVCAEIETYLVSVKVSASEPYVVEEYSACLDFPPWCKKLVTKIRNNMRTQNLVKARIVDKCCEGYTKHGNHCVPLCQDGCIYGTCISPNTCHCYGNYEGSRCDSCIADCNGTSVQKMCPPGFQGPDCDTECPPHKYGHGCILNCTCENGSKCDPVTGECKCAPGWTGDNCNNSCPDGKYGTNCLNECECLTESQCRKTDGLCECEAGWTGKNCDKLCDHGYYGPNCVNRCNCEGENCICDSVRGCVCKTDSQNNMAEKNSYNSMKPDSNSFPNIYIIYIVIAILFFFALLSFMIIKYRGKFQKSRPEYRSVNSEEKLLPTITQETDFPTELYDGMATPNYHIYNEIVYSQEHDYDHLDFRIPVSAPNSPYQKTTSLMKNDTSKAGYGIGHINNHIEHFV